MNWLSFLEGGLSVIFAYAIFSQGFEEESEDIEIEETDDEEETPQEKKRYFTMFCGTCRKQQKHVKVREDVFQCNRCKRTVDLREG